MLFLKATGNGSVPGLSLWLVGSHLILVFYIIFLLRVSVSGSKVPLFVRTPVILDEGLLYWLNYLCRDPFYFQISLQCEIPGFRTSSYLSLGGVDTIQLITLARVRWWQGTSPLAETLCFQRKGPGFDHCSGNWTHMLQLPRLKGSTCHNSDLVQPNK